MTQHAQITPAPVRKSFTVAATPEHAFAVFTRMGGWWLKGHSIAASGQADVTIEPRVGGRWYETGKDGETCPWGEVLAWEPPHRLVLVWRLSSRWTYDPALRTEIEVRFTPEGAGTRVDFEHRKLEAYGEAAAAMSESLGKPDGWPALLQAFAKAV